MKDDQELEHFKQLLKWLAAEKSDSVDLLIPTKGKPHLSDKINNQRKYRKGIKKRTNKQERKNWTIKQERKKNKEGKKTVRKKEVSKKEIYKEISAQISGEKKKNLKNDSD